MKNRLKLVAFSLIPALFLILGAEITFRVLRFDTPNLITLPLPGEDVGLFVHDPDLFWSLAPNLKIRYKNKVVSTNTLGLRSGEIREKEKNEFRILSLGESSTFGDGVSDWGTYTHRLQEDLQDRVKDLKIRTINAGVSAYSSFQSLKFLELRGLRLGLDMVIFYHEVNDYLPSALRNSNNNEIGVLKTDRELYNSRFHTFKRKFMSLSALYRFFSFKLAKSKIDSLSKRNLENPVQNIGIPYSISSNRLVMVNNRRIESAKINEVSVGSRVTENERIENFKSLIRLCNENNIKLVIIHPTYAPSFRHECVLTAFLKKENIPYFEAFDILHPNFLPRNYFYRDVWHPNEEGHRELSLALADYIYNNYFDKDNTVSKLDSD